MLAPYVQTYTTYIHFNSLYWEGQDRILRHFRWSSKIWRDRYIFDSWYEGNHIWFLATGYLIEMDLLFCEICDNPFSSKKTLAFHKKSHALDYKTPCPTCNKEFRKTYLKKHILNCFQIEEAQKEFHCQFCPKTFTEIQNLNRHLQIHDEMFENESCKLCPKTFPRKDSKKACEVKTWRLWCQK